MRSVELERWIAEHEFGIAVVRHFVVDSDDVYVLKADVQSRPGLAVPEEVRHLLRVGHVVSRLQRSLGVQIVDEHVVRRRLDTRTCRTIIIDHLCSRCCPIKQSLCHYHSNFYLV